MAGVAQYSWNCSVPDDDDGERYIPGIEINYSILARSSVPIVPTAGDIINLYRVQSLNADCTREAVTAIEFCYRYNNTDGPGEAVFNWTVLILEEGNEFTITRMIAIVSHPNELEEDYCMDNEGGRQQVECCDREDISMLNIQKNFILGVTESAQGNTHEATLLGVHESLAEYTVHTLQLSATGKNISVGSTLIRPETGQTLGLRLLRFVIGKHKINTCGAILI